MQKRILTIVVFSALLAPAVFPQGMGPGMGMRPGPVVPDTVASLVTRLTRLLDLTAAQQTQATSIFSTEETALSALATSMATAQTALQTAVRKNDSPGITGSANQIGSLTAQQVTAQGKAEAGFYVILSPEQQAKYEELLMAGMGSMGPMGTAGGHGGPGGGMR